MPPAAAGTAAAKLLFDRTVVDRETAKSALEPPPSGRRAQTVASSPLRSRRTKRHMPLLFAVTVFLSAALLFVVEPLVGKLLLPLAGGTPAVWTTCMLFFQSALLAGYAYANYIAGRLATRSQVILHVLVVAVPLLFLPVAVNRADVARSAFPALALLPVLAATVGLPFFALATTAR